MNKIQAALESALEAVNNNYKDCIFHVSEKEFIKDIDKYIELDAVIRIHRGDKGDVVMMPYELYKELSSHSSTE